MRLKERVRLASAHVAALLLLPLLATAAPMSDGPYVLPTQGGGWVARWVEGDEASPTVRESAVRVGGSVTIPAVGTRPSFRVRVRDEATVPASEVTLPASAKLFVIADTHGEFEIATELLQRHGVIDRSLEWSFGSGRLAILGDVFDRGPHHTELFWLIYKLEAQAKAAGGAVHFVLGNHETMVLLGDRGYLHPRYLRSAAALSAPTYASLWSTESLLGQWLRTKPAVQKIGDLLCLHGGLSAEMLGRKLSLDAINQAVRDALTYTEPYAGRRPRYAPGDLAVLGRSPAATDADRERSRFVTFSPLGPLWYRGYFPEAAREGGFPVASDGDVGATLTFFGARRILVGHTIVPTVTSLYGGKVLAVQVYPHLDEQTAAPVAEGVLIEKGRVLRAKIDGTTEPL